MEITADGRIVMKQIKCVSEIPELTPDLLSLIDSLWNSPTITPWNDEQIYKPHYLEKAATFKLSEITILCSHASVFLNWYVGQEISHKRLALSCKILLLSMKYEDSFIFPDKFVHADDVVVAAADNTTIQKIASASFANDNLGTLETQRIRLWYANVWINLHSTNHKTVQTCINYLGYVLLNMMRLITKSRASVEKHIVRSVTRQFNNIWGKTFIISATPPPYADKCYTTFLFAFKKGEKDCSDMLVYILEALEHPRPNLINTTQSIIKSGCSLVLSETGLGLVHWLKKAAEKLELNPLHLIDYFRCDPYKKTAIHCSNFFKMAETEYSWIFARLFNDAALKTLSIKSQPTMASTFLHIIYVGEELKLMLNIDQFKKNLSEKDIFMGNHLAKTLIKHVIENRDLS